MSKSKENNLKDLFELIDKAGGPNLGPKVKLLTFQERLKVSFNFMGFLFGFFYYLYHGIWKKALTLTIITVVLSFIILLILPTFKMAWIIGPVIFATRANPDLYKKYRLKSDNWI